MFESVLPYPALDMFMTGFQKENYQLSVLQGSPCFLVSCWPSPTTRALLIHRCHRAVSSWKRGLGLETLHTLHTLQEEKCTPACWLTLRPKGPSPEAPSPRVQSHSPAGCTPICPVVQQGIGRYHRRSRLRLHLSTAQFTCHVLHVFRARLCILAFNFPWEQIFLIKHFRYPPSKCTCLEYALTII